MGVAVGNTVPDADVRRLREEFTLGAVLWIKMAINVGWRRFK